MTTLLLVVVIVAPGEKSGDQPNSLCSVIEVQQIFAFLWNISHKHNLKQATSTIFLSLPWSFLHREEFLPLLSTENHLLSSNHINAHIFLLIFFYLMVCVIVNVNIRKFNSISSTFLNILRRKEENKIKCNNWLQLQFKFQVFLSHLFPHLY